MADTSIKISLELADRAAQKALSDFISKGSSAEKSLDKLKSKGKSTFDEIAISLGKASGFYDIFAGNLAANLATKSLESIASAASSLFNVFIIDGVKAASEQEDAINALNVALAQSGIYSKDASEDFVQFADTLAATTTVQDDVILKNAALIQSMAQLDQAGLKRATSAALDLSAALGKDVESASKALAKAANGNVTELQKMGIQIEKGSTNAQTFANALAAVESKFGGSAASKVNTYSGAVAQASNSFNDLQEEIGRFIIQNPAVIAVINEAAKIFRELSETTKDQSGAFKAIGNAISIFTSVGAFAITMVDQFTRVMQTLVGVAQAWLLVFSPIYVAIRSISVGFSEASKEVKSFATSMSNNITALGESGDGALSELAINLLRLKDAADKGTESLATGATKAVAPLNNTTGKVKELTEEMKRSQDVLKSFAVDLVKQSETAKTGATLQLESAKAKADSELAIEQELLNQKLITQADYQVRKSEIEAEYEASRKEIALTQYDGENQQLEAARQQNLITEQQYQAAKGQLEANYAAQKQKLEADGAKTAAANRKATLDAEKQLQDSKVAAVAGTFGALSSLMQTSSKELFEIGKAAAIAQATINTYQAITATMASVPYPFNIPLAVAQGIAGAVQVANIVNTRPSFEQGGIVPGSSFSGDRVVANVNSGEMILNRQQQRQLFDQANGLGGDNSRVEALLGSLINAIQNQAIVVNVGGKTIVDTLRSELQSGRTFA